MTARTVLPGGAARHDPRDVVTAWRPEIPGISEVFHARFTRHAYPPHTHDRWTLLIVDTGAVRYDLDRHEHGALQESVTLLPPEVTHDGRPAREGGFRKRVLYLEPEVIGLGLIGRAVDRPDFVDTALRSRVAALHTVLGAREHTDRMQAESRLALIAQRLREHLLGRAAEEQPAPVRSAASALRDLLDSRIEQGLDLAEAAGLLGVGPAHLIRSFSAAYGLPPHRYLTGRRVERARRLLLEGMPIGEVAVASGFYDQAHLTRHLRRTIGTTPGTFRRAS